MADSSQYLRSKTRSTFLTSLFSISLALFVLILLVAAALYFDYLRGKWQEEFEMILVLDEEPGKERQTELLSLVQSYPWCSGVRYVSKEDAEAEFLSTTGDEFYSEIVGDINPMNASLNIRLKVEWIQADSISQISKELEKIQELAEIEYPIQYIHQLRENTRTLYFVAIATCILVVFVAFFIISGTIRLAIFAKRLVIRSMQLIGARNGFIRRPFVKMGMFQGALGGIIAAMMLVGVMLGAAGFFQELSELKMLIQTPAFASLLGGIVIFGAVLGWLSSRIAVNRFLNKPLDELM